MAREEGWLAEHMLIVGITNPQARAVHCDQSHGPVGQEKVLCSRVPFRLRQDQLGNDDASLAWMEGRDCRR
jgi:GTP-dependent phosphoenolpyruvate carboxykinase